MSIKKKTKLQQIIEGWSNYTFRDPKVERIAKARAEICAGCPHAKLSFWMNILRDAELEEVEGMICDICLCPISTASRSLDKECPKGYWPDNDEILKKGDSE